MEKNIGDLDAYLRITGGLTLLGIGVMNSSKTAAFLGAMKVAEGITRYCPVMHMLNLNSHQLEFKLKDRIEKPTEFELS